MTERTTDEIDAEKTAKELALRAADDSLNCVMTEIYAVEKMITDLENRKADLREAARKARHNMRGIESEIRILTNEFWSRKKGRAL